jgi:hypothetical protein
MFGHMGRLLAWWSKRSPDLLHRACVVTTLASVLLTNGTCCVVPWSLSWSSPPSRAPRRFVFYSKQRTVTYY